MIVITLNIIVITSKIVLLILNCSKLITMNNIKWEEVFKPNYRHFSNVEYLKSNPRLMYELDLTHLVYCTQMMLIATHPSN